jgi:CheY-like chemotaxis protein
MDFHEVRLGDGGFKVGCEFASPDIEDKYIHEALPDFLCPVGGADDVRLVAPPPILAPGALYCGLSLGLWIRSVARNRSQNRYFHWQAVAFGSAGEYIAYPRPDLPACLILDVELPDINGLDFQKQIAYGDHPPIVFLTGHGDIPSSVRAIKHGAVDFLTEPFTERDLLEAIRSAVERDRQARQGRAELEIL